MRRMIGVGYRHHWAEWIDTRPEEIECLEVTAEHFFDGGDERLRQLASLYPVFVHGLGLSLGTPGPLDQFTLERFAQVVSVANPLWISEHVAFTRTSEVDLGHLNPVRPCEDMLAVIAENAQALMQRCGKPLILENITSHLPIKGSMSETTFLNRLCELAGCGLLLDVTNLFINSKNHGFDPVSWFRDLESSRIVQLHVVGYGFHDGKWDDDHSRPIQEELFELAREICNWAPIQGVIIERDASFPSNEEMASELRRLREAVNAH